MYLPFLPFRIPLALYSPCLPIKRKRAIRTRVELEAAYARVCLSARPPARARAPPKHQRPYRSITEGAIAPCVSSLTLMPKSEVPCGQHGNEGATTTTVTRKILNLG